MNRIMISFALLLCLSPSGEAKESVRLAQRDDDRVGRVLDTRPSRPFADAISREAGKVRRVAGERTARDREFVRDAAIERDREQRDLAVRRDKAVRAPERHREFATRALGEKAGRPSYRSPRTRDGIQRWVRDDYEARTLSADARERERVERFKEVDRQPGKVALQYRNAYAEGTEKDRANAAAEKDLALRDSRQPLEIRDRATREVREPQAAFRNARNFRTA